MKVVLSPWFYGSCTRYMICPKIPDETELVTQYNRLGLANENKKQQLEEALQKHLDSYRLLQLNKIDDFILHWKGSIQILLSYFPQSIALNELQIMFLNNLLYYLQKLIIMKRYTAAFQVCYETQPLFKQNKFNLTREVQKAYYAQFLALYACVYKKQNKLEAALQISKLAVEVDTSLRPDQSFDRYSTVLLNYTYLLQDDYKAQDALPFIKKALVHCPRCHDTMFSHLFISSLAKQRTGIANVICSHLNGMVQLGTKDSQTQVKQWYDPFDLTLQKAIQYFAQLDNLGACWNNPVIAWALIDLEIVEQLAKKHDKRFVGSLQKGRYQNVVYFLYKDSEQKFKNRASRLAGEFLDDYCGIQFYQTPSLVKNISQPKNLALSLSKSKIQFKQYPNKPDLIKRCYSCIEVHNYNQHLSKTNTNNLRELKNFKENMVETTKSKIPQPLSIKAKVTRCFTPQLVKELVPKSLEIVTTLVRYKYGNVVDPFNLQLQHLEKPEKEDIQLKRVQKTKVKLDKSKFSELQLETLAAERIQDHFKNVFLKNKKQLVLQEDKVGQAALAIQKEALRIIYQSRYQLMKDSTLKIQSWFKKAIAIRQYSKSILAIQDIQRYYRGILVRRQMSDCLVQINKLQAAFKMKIIMRKVNKMKKLALQIQMRFRKNVNSNVLTPIQWSVRIIQRYCRTASARQKYIVEISNIKRIQQKAIEFVMFNRYQMKLQAAICIQKTYRVNRQQSKFTKYQNATIIIQSLIKRNKEMAKYKHIKQSIKKMQKYYKKNKGTISYAKIGGFLQIIKSYFMRHAEQNRLRKIENSAKIIQLAARCYNSQKLKYNKMEALKILQPFLARKHTQLCIRICKNTHMKEEQMKINVDKQGIIKLSSAPRPSFQDRFIIAKPKYQGNLKQQKDLIMLKKKQTCDLSKLYPTKLHTYQRNKYLKNNVNYKQNILPIDELTIFNKGQKLCAFQHDFFEITEEHTIFNQNFKRWQKINGGSYEQRLVLFEEEIGQKMTPDQEMYHLKKMNRINIEQQHKRRHWKRNDTKNSSREPQFEKAIPRFYSQLDLHNIKFAQNDIYKQHTVENSLMTRDQSTFIASQLNENVLINMQTFNFPYRCRDKFVFGQPIVTLQKMAKGYLQFKKYQNQILQIQKIKAPLLGKQQRKKNIQYKNSACIIQNYYRQIVQNQISQKQSQSLVPWTPNLFKLTAKVNKIQNYIRHYQVIKQNKSQFAAAVQIQRFVKGNYVRRKLENEKLNVKKLQLFLSPHAQRQAFLNFKKNIGFIQWTFRFHLKAKEVQALQVIQIFYRRKCGKTLFSSKKLKLHSMLKGCLVRKQNHQLLTATSIIQKYVRKHQDQKYADQRSKAIIKIQHNIMQVYNPLQRYLQKIQTIQKMFRYAASFKRQQTICDQIAYIQAIGRGYLVRKQSLKQYIAIKRIQLHYRKIIARVDITNQFKASVIIQKFTRSFQSTQKLEQYNKQVETLQNIIRRQNNVLCASTLVRTMKTQQLSSAITIQSFVRKFFFTQLQKYKMGAALIIQHASRGLVYKNRARARKYAVARIQRFYKDKVDPNGPLNLQIKKILKLEKKACVIIQSTFKLNKVLADQIRDKQAVLCIQQILKGMKESKQIIIKREAISTLQQHFKVFISMKKLKKSVNAVLLLQKVMTAKIKAVKEKQQKEKAKVTQREIIYARSQRIKSVLKEE
ncbi:Abnormal_spindle-like microcephaly-associated protein-like protein [Hexamita inflata]|uniref:Abnormal spindle-like microcephaly-associated protein-like protein n=1 Tax=Hexamita inflata TaxID=28002 RepID=A0AA86TS24_9EUKA|nr:Abnormal spindle-like microcephaly-associated protein-like protein [Hexamita inflata]